MTSLFAYDDHVGYNAQKITRYKSYDKNWKKIFFDESWTRILFLFKILQNAGFETPLLVSGKKLSENLLVFSKFDLNFSKSIFPENFVFKM